jgi:hypothetical protein
VKHLAMIGFGVMVGLGMIILSYVLIVFIVQLLQGRI